MDVQVGAQLLTCIEQLEQCLEIGDHGRMKTHGMNSANNIVVDIIVGKLEASPMASGGNEIVP